MERQTFQAEAQVLARHLVGRPPTEAMVERYGEAHQLLLGKPGEDGRGAAVAAFALRHPWSLPFLEAACGIMQPQRILRSKLLLMAAVLEASPEFADDFLPRDTPRTALAAKLVFFGLAAVTRTVLGLLLYPVVRR